VVAVHRRGLHEQQKVELSRDLVAGRDILLRTQALVEGPQERVVLAIQFQLHEHSERMPDKRAVDDRHRFSSTPEAFRCAMRRWQVAAEMCTRSASTPDGKRRVLLEQVEGLQVESVEGHAMLTQVRPGFCPAAQPMLGGDSVERDHQGRYAQLHERRAGDARTTHAGAV
jgi:hypothetical protein